MFHDAIHSRGREKMMKRKGMSCHTLPTSMISGVICYWSPSGLLNLLSKVNLVFLVDLPFPHIYLQLLLLSIWRRSHTCRSGVQLLKCAMHTKWRSQTCRSGIWFFSFMQCTLIGSTKWVDSNCLHSKLDSIDKWLLHYEIGLPNPTVAEERNLIVVSISCVHYHCFSLFGISGFSVAVLLHSFFMFYSCRIWQFAYIKFFVWLRI